MVYANDDVVYTRNVMTMQRVYIETSVVSYLTGRTSTDVIVAVHQSLTQTWWEHRAPLFSLLISQLVYDEAAAGHPDAANARLAALADLQVLPVTLEAINLARSITTRGLMPVTFESDALHIAIAAVQGADYLLTWNCKHIANATHRANMMSHIEEMGFACPVICTPEELLEG